MTWADGPMLCFDTETTSADPETARIVTATCTIVQPDAEPTVFEWLIDPGVEIPAEATAIHGISTEYARELGKQPEPALRGLADVINGWWNRQGPFPLVVYNASYDLTVLDRELTRHGLEHPTPGPVVDPFVLDKHVDRYRKGSRKLTDACAHYRVPIGDAHTSEADCIAAGRVAWRITRMYPQIGDMPLTELHALQAEAYRSQARGLREYFIRKGNMEAAATVSEDWPLRPVKVTA